MSEYKSIIKSLNEAIDYEKGKLKGVRKRKIEIAPLLNFTNQDIKEIRNNLNLSQKTFADLMGVSIKTIEAWESGKNTPSGPAQRILELIKENNALVEKFVHVI